jgi:hypothetical protein
MPSAAGGVRLKTTPSYENRRTLRSVNGVYLLRPAEESVTFSNIPPVPV